MKIITLEDILKPEYWKHMQRDILGCGDFCIKYYPIISKVAAKYRPRIMLDPSGDHFWIELIIGRRRFIIDAAVPFTPDPSLFYVGFQDKCIIPRLKTHYENGQHDESAKILEKKALGKITY